jgi:hypothetical protein
MLSNIILTFTLNALNICNASGFGDFVLSHSIKEVDR